MKILPLVKDLQEDITLSGMRIKKASIDGYNVANRTARIYKQSNVRKYINVTKTVSNKVVKGTTIREIPYLAGALGVIFPVPLTSPLFLEFGFLARFIVSKSTNLHDILNSSMAKELNIKV